MKIHALSKVWSAAGLTIAGALIFGVMSAAASAQTTIDDPLHGFCVNSANCSAQNGYIQTNQNPAQFGFDSSPSGDSGSLMLVFLIPDNVAQPGGGVGVAGLSGITFSGTATLVSGGPFVAGDKLDTYLGLSASPSDPFSSIDPYLTTAPPGYDVYTVTIPGTVSVVGQSSEPGGPEFDTTISLPTNTAIMAFLDDANGWVATAPSSQLDVVPGTLPPPIPEPSSLVLLGTGVLGLAGVVRRRFGR